MSPMQLSDFIQSRRREIAEDLNSSAKSGADYAYAYGRLEVLAMTAAIEAAAMDPSFGLSTLTYDEIIAREG